MQIPKVDFPASFLARITSAALISLMPFMHAANAPTPGTTNPSAFKATSKSDVISTS
jgi:hypothetical protein